MSLRHDIYEAMPDKNESFAIFLAQQICALQASIALNAPSAYTPGDATKWPVQPVSIQDALDKLAARVYALEHP